MKLDHYVIRVGEPNIYGNFVPVGILWYVKEISAPSPFSSNHDTIYIKMPNLIERIFKITLENKIEIAKQVLTRRAECHLAENLTMQGEMEGK